MAATGRINDGPISKFVHNRLDYLCAKFGAFIKKCTIGLNVQGKQQHYMHHNKQWSPSVLFVNVNLYIISVATYKIKYYTGIERTSKGSRASEERPKASRASEERAQVSAAVKRDLGRVEQVKKELK